MSFESREFFETTTQTLATHLDSPLTDLKLIRCLSRNKIQIRNSSNGGIMSNSPTTEYLKRHHRIDKGLTAHLQWITQNTSLFTFPVIIGFQPVRNLLYGAINDSSQQNSPYLEKELHKHIGIAISNSSIQINASPGPEMSPFDDFQIKVSRHNEYSLLKQYFVTKMILEQGSLLSGCRSQKTDSLERHGWKKSQLGSHHLFQHSNQLGIYLWDQLSVIQFGHQTYVGTRSHFLELADVASQRFMVILSSIIADLLYDPTYLPPDILLGTFSWGDSILNQQGNEGYSSISLWESLVIGFILQLYPDPYVDNEEFLKKMRDEFLTKHQNNRQHFVKFMDLMKKSQGNPNQLFQMFGLYRIWGHPTVSAKEGIKKLKTYACKKRLYNYQKIELINRKFKEYLCISYYKKNSMWPALELSQLPKFSYLYKVLSHNLPLIPSHPQYNQNDWRFIHAKKTFDIPKQYDVSELISDKAMSFGYSKLIESIVKHHNIGTSAERSVLIQWIQSNLGDPEVFLNEINVNGFPVDEIVVGVCPKERELKLQARLFGLLTLIKRMYVVITEALIADNILPLFNEITMKDDQSQLLSRHHKTTRDMGAKRQIDQIHIVINSDFEKWNSNMRYEETIGCFQFMDELFGFEKVISRTHEMFNRCYLYLADGSYVPKVIDGVLQPDEYIWTHHLGGIEGLRQKGWTVWTVVILKYVTERTGTQCSILGQGDNQVIVCRYRNYLNPDAIRKAHGRFLDELTSFLGDIGPPLKKEETWCSSRLFMYGKYSIYQGTPMAMSQKKICRMMKVSNEGFPTIESCLSSLSANVFDSSWVSAGAYIPFFCYSFETALALDFHLYESMLIEPYLKKAQRHSVIKIPDGVGGQIKTTVNISAPLTQTLIRGENQAFLKMLMLFPRCLGGYPITLLGDIYLRGFSDPVTLALSQLKRIREKTEDPTLSGWISNILRPVMSPIKNYDLLFEDPTSLNLLHPSSPSDQVKRLVLQMIQDSSFPKSQNFQLFIATASDEQQDLKRSLLTMTPHYNPRVAHEILHATVPSKARSMLERIEKTNTLVRLMSKGLQFDLNKRLCISEVNYVLSILYQLSYISPRIEILCATNYANFLRNYSWNLSISGVTTACPWEFSQIVLSPDSLCHDGNCANPALGKIIIKSLIQNPKSISENILLGPSSPYLGKKTSMKSVNQFGRTVSKLSSPLLKNCISLIQLIGWGTSSNSALAELLRSLFRSITDLSPSLIELQEAQVSGSVEHRFQDVSTKHGCYLPFLYTASSWLSMNTSTLTQYSKGSGNVNLSFQSMLIFIESCYTAHPWGQVMAHMHIKCPSCIQPIYEGMLDIDQAPSIPIYSDHPLFWVNASNISVLSKVSVDLYRTVRFSVFIKDHQDRRTFSILVAQMYFKLIRSHDVEHYSADLISSVLEIIPMTWIFKMDPIIFLETFTLLFLCFVLYHNFQTIEMKENAIQSLLSMVRTYLLSLSPLWFAPLTSLFFNSDLIQLLTSEGLIIPPGGCPPTTISKCNAIRDSVLKCIPRCLLISSLDIFGLSPWPEMSWSWVTVAILWMSDKIKYHVLKEWRSKLPVPLLKESGGLVTLNWMLHHSHVTLASTVSIHEFQELRLALMICKPVFVDFNIDNLAKLLDAPSLKPRKAGNQLSLESLKKTSIAILQYKSHSHQALDTTSSLGFKFDLPTSQPLHSLTGDISWSSTFKPHVLTTTAIYRTLSVMSHLKMKDYHSVLCSGDGAGSFTLASLILGAREVWYNSLLESDSLSPQGLTGYIPADFYHFPSHLPYIKGLELTTYGDSNVTSSNWHTQYGHLSGDLLITCDAEFARNDYEAYVKALYNFIKIGSQTTSFTLLIKVYIDNYSFFNFLCQWIKNLFFSIKIYRSMYSNQNQKEVFVLCSGFNRDIHTKVELLDKQHFRCLISLDRELNDLIHTMSINVPWDVSSLSKTTECVLGLFDESIMKRKVDAILADYSVPVSGTYPLSTKSWWDWELSYLGLKRWQTYKKLRIGELSRIVNREWASRHMFLLLLSAVEKESFREWLKLCQTGRLIFWRSASGMMRSAVTNNYFSSVPRKEFFSIPLSSILTRPLIKIMISDCALLRALKYTPGYTLIVSILEPLLLSKFSTKKWFNSHNQLLYSLPDLPKDLSLSKRVFQSYYQDQRQLTLHSSETKSHERIHLSYSLDQLDGKIMDIFFRHRTS